MLRHTIVGAAVAATTVTVLVVTPAVASAPHVVTQVSRSGLPTGWQLSSSGTFCMPVGTVEPTSTHVTGPATAPLGTGSLVVAVPPGESAQLVEALPADADQELTAASIESYRFPVTSGDTPMTAAAHLIIDTGTSNEVYDLNAPLAASSSTWAPLNLYTANSKWLEYMTGAVTQPQIGTGTYSSFISSGHPGTLATYEFDFLNCGSTTQSYAVDDVTTGLKPAGTDTRSTVDFEAATTTITGTLSRPSVVAGGRVTPSVKVSVKGVHPLEVKVTLAKKTAGSTYRTVATELTNAQGDATGPTQRPTATTSYRWSYTAPSGNTFSSATSAATTVHVAPKITITGPRQAVGAGKSVTVTGSASPKAKGAVVTLWRTKGAHRVKLAHGTEKANGRFRLSKHLPAGTYHLFVTVAKTSANSAGTSPKRAVTVR